MQPRAPAEQPRRDHPGIVEYQQLVAAEELGQLGEVRIGPSAAPAVEHQQARGIPCFRRPLRYLLAGKLVVQFVDSHSRECSAGRSRMKKRSLPEHRGARVASPKASARARRLPYFLYLIEHESLIRAATRGNVTVDNYIYIFSQCVAETSTAA